ncbi:MAG: tRNA lysidine(34) synthetase TilS, partial [Sphingopyxis sp.]|nr:tRNA lysidine(34) synthetase TilS [Sphingopyxis sp.]
MPGHTITVSGLGAELDASTRRLIGDEAAATDRFGIAVSGGPDSMALLLLAAECWPGRVAAATVDHQLRVESADEAAMVAGICSEKGIPHVTLTPAAPIIGSLQSAARAARYALLEDWRAAHGLDWLLTAHHADDQLETLIMRLNRRSGIGGLSGVRARRGHILRPLLHLRRDDLANWLHRQNVTAIDDPSNRNPDFDRARLRRALAGVDWFDPQAATDSMAHLADAEDALEWMTAQMVATRLTAADGGTVEIDVTGLPAELLRRLLL